MSRSTPPKHSPEALTDRRRIPWTLLLPLPPPLTYSLTRSVAIDRTERSTDRLPAVLPSVTDALQPAAGPMRRKSHIAVFNLRPGRRRSGRPAGSSSSSRHYFRGNGMEEKVNELRQRQQENSMLVLRDSFADQPPPRQTPLRPPRSNDGPYSLTGYSSSCAAMTSVFLTQRFSVRILAQFLPLIAIVMPHCSLWAKRFSRYEATIESKSEDVYSSHISVTKREIIIIIMSAC